MNIEVKRLLPIGTIVVLKNTTRKLMIISNIVKEINKDNEEIYHDYLGCLYPAGVIDTSYNYFFNDDDIEQIVSYGPMTDEEFQAKLVAQNLIEEKKYGPYTNK